MVDASLDNGFPSHVLGSVIPLAPKRLPYGCSLPSLAGFSGKRIGIPFFKGNHLSVGPAGQSLIVGSRAY